MKRARSSIDNLRGPILRSVSRSFYLSIRLLPAQLRDPIALAYLLARATDTLADTAEASATLRDKSLQKLAHAIQGSLSENEVSGLRESFAPLQKNAAERALVEALPSCLGWLEHLQESDRDDVRAVLKHINAGQLLDVRRFVETTEVCALATESDLDEYTYLVAGCVGEFWTQTLLSSRARFLETVSGGNAKSRSRVRKGITADKYFARCRFGFREWTLLFSRGGIEGSRSFP